MNYAGLIYDDSRHYIDHLAPFCAQIGWPLIVCEPTIADLCRQFYPDLQVLESPFWELKLPPYVVACDPVPMIEAAFPGQKTKAIWLPHGNSDKGWKGPFFQGLGEVALVYGQRMIDFMRAKNVHPQTLSVGNFRYRYFLKHHRFYESQFSIPRGILYAPTWEDSENNGSFWKAFPELAEKFPHLIVKLHPNTIRKYEAKIEVLMGRYSNRFLPDTPPIYPILSQCEALICDMSSIGYDFLTFDRPLHFVNQNRDFPLHRCIDSQTRKETYVSTFDSDPDWNQIREKIYSLCEGKMKTV